MCACGEPYKHVIDGVTAPLGTAAVLYWGGKEAAGPDLQLHDKQVRMCVCVCMCVCVFVCVCVCANGERMNKLGLAQQQCQGWQCARAKRKRRAKFAAAQSGAHLCEKVSMFEKVYVWN